MTRQLEIAILGAAGYAGVNLVRLALSHPNIKIKALGTRRKDGEHLREIWPQFLESPLPPLRHIDEIDYSSVDVAFSCMPHGVSAQRLSQLTSPHIIDLSADFRLDCPETYAQWYDAAHPCPDLLSTAVYGLSEFAKEYLPRSRLVACPGCYPTAVLLSLLPLVENGLIDTTRIVINALSGLSGAGRSGNNSHLFSEANESVQPYNVGHHRHVPEIEQELSKRAKKTVSISFTPHLVPMTRGELTTTVVELCSGVSVDDLQTTLSSRYDCDPFVYVLQDDACPSTDMVRGTNNCVLSAFSAGPPGQAVIIAAIDNLVKGAAGQAIQNMNLLFGFPETAGLKSAPLMP